MSDSTEDLAMKRIAIACGAALLLVGSPASAGMDVLDPATARDEVAKSEGVVFVDLFAEW
jgi:hypothetical protein